MKGTRLRKGGENIGIRARKKRVIKPPAVGYGAHPKAKASPDEVVRGGKKKWITNLALARFQRKGKKENPARS